jgi:SAM-dependent methyltransferase
MQKQVKSIARQITPLWLKRLRLKLIFASQRKINQDRPIKEVFDEIYSRNQWGGNSGELFSGSGSTEGIAVVYAQMIRDFIERRNITKVLDLGCGDFLVGSKFQMPGVQYIGVDIVEKVIQQNQQRYSSDTVSFQCLDILSEDLPDAELCLIRQVLQHLSNDEIATVVQKIIRSKKYKYVIVTEHYPAPNVKVKPNLDKPHGADTRIIDDSAVYLDSPPFNVPNVQMILEVDAPRSMMNKGEKIRSFLIERNA